MSATQIIEELPRLTEHEIRLVRHRLVELAEQDSEIKLCNEIALERALLLDRMEEEDRSDQSR